MLSRPEHGWTDFSLGKKQYALSYLTDIHFDWLDQAIHGLESMLPFVVHGFCEPGRMLCTVSYWNCHIIFEDEWQNESAEEAMEYEVAHVSMLQFCKNLYADISSELSAWVHWQYLICDDPEEKKEFHAEIEQELRTRLDRLRTLIAVRESSFDDRHCFF